MFASRLFNKQLCDMHLGLRIWDLGYLGYPALRLAFRYLTPPF